jgi:hypothetical protein
MGTLVDNWQLIIIMIMVMMLMVVLVGNRFCIHMISQISIAQISIATAGRPR